MTVVSGNSMMEHNEKRRIDPWTEVDNVLCSLGRTGRYQIIQMFLIMLFIMENSFHLVSSVYIGKYLLLPYNDIAFFVNLVGIQQIKKI